MTTPPSKIKKSNTAPSLPALHQLGLKDVDVEWVPLPRDTPQNVLLSTFVEDVQQRTTELLSLQEEINTLNNRIQQHDKTYNSITSIFDKAMLEAKKQASIMTMEDKRQVESNKQRLKRNLDNLLLSLNDLQKPDYKFTDEQKTTLQWLKEHAQRMHAQMHVT